MKRSTLHAIFLKGGERIPFTSAGRARSVRRALYIERKRLLKLQVTHGDPRGNIADAANKLQFRLEGCTLIVEPIPSQSPVDVELERLRAGVK